MEDAGGQEGPCDSGTLFSRGRELIPGVLMDWKKILIGGVAGGVLLLVALMVFDFIGNFIAPYNIFTIGGMRQMNDPLMYLFYAYPFVLSFLSAIVFDQVKAALKPACCGCAGLTFGLILILLVTVPGMFVIYSSMVYPTGFYIGNILFGLIGFPALGMLYARIWGI